MEALGDEVLILQLEHCSPRHIKDYPLIQHLQVATISERYDTPLEKVRNYANLIK